jgi:hypothetical protein
LSGHQRLALETRENVALHLVPERQRWLAEVFWRDDDNKDHLKLLGPR